MADPITYNLKYNKCLLFGDSITEYSFNPVTFLSSELPLGKQEIQFLFGSAMTNYYIRKLQIAHYGFAGFNSRHAKHMIPYILKNEPDIKVAVVFFGTNDAVLGGPQLVALEEYESNIREVVRQLHEKNIKVVLIAPGLHNSDAWNKNLTPQDIEANKFRNNENNKLYADTAVKLASELKIPVVNLFEQFSNYDGDWKELLSDGIHYSGKGYIVMFGAVVQAIEKYYPELKPENLPTVMPLFRQLPTDEKHLMENLNNAN